MSDRAAAVTQRTHREVQFGPLRLPGELNLPAKHHCLVVFAHGSGSSRHSPRNRWVAAQLHAQGLGTLLFDLLSPDESQDRSKVFDIALLRDRLLQVMDALNDVADTQRVGLFGASTGAAAALQAAAAQPQQVVAVVSRGGRVDLAGEQLTQVRAPTLLIVGGADTPVLALNREAMRCLRCERRLDVVPQATHLFEEPGALEAVAQAAGDWFLRHSDCAAPELS